MNEAETLETCIKKAQSSLHEQGVIGEVAIATRMGARVVNVDLKGYGNASWAMPGNPVLTGIGRLFFSSACGDFHCGLRGFRRDAILSMDLRTTGMEFASELVVKATLFNLKISEVPVTLSPDGRSRPPHLRSWRDGWRHLRSSEAKSEISVDMSIAL